MSNPTTILAAALTLTATLAAQTVAPTLKTAADLGVYAGTSIKAVAGGTAITRPLQLATRTATAGASSTASLVMPTATQPAAGARIAWAGRAIAGTPTGMAGTTDSQRGGQGPQVYTLAFAVRAAQKGKLLLSFAGKGNNRSAFASAAVDIGGRVIRLPSGTPVRRTLTGITIPTTGLTAKLTVVGKADATSVRESTYAGQLALLFVPDGGSTGGCTFTIDKRSCREGGLFAARAVKTTRGTEITFRLQGMPNAAGFALIAPTGDTNPLNIGAMCILLKTPTIFATFKTDASGVGSTKILIPKIVPGTAWFQAASARAVRNRIVIAGSNTLKAVCR